MKARMLESIIQQSQIHHNLKLIGFAERYYGELLQYCAMTRFLTKTAIGRSGRHVSAAKLVSLYYTMRRDSPFADKRQWKKY